MPLTRIEIQSRVPFRMPGIEGPAYERIDGIAHFATDPALPANSEIAGLDRAERGDDGLVHFDADVCILRPIGGGTRRMLFDVSNRGGKTAMVFINRGARPLIPTPEIDPGDGFLMAHGWTIAWCGWQWDVPEHPAMLGLRAPQVLGPDGRPLEGMIRVQIAGAQRRAFAGLKDESVGPSLFRPYPVADAADPAATLTERAHPEAQPVLIPRERWRFARLDGDGNEAPSDAHVLLEGGFEPGKTYEVTYRTRACPLVGSGLLAVRDFVSFARHENNPSANPLAGSIDRAHAFGVSQSGRFLRTFLYHGQNLDEAGRQVFDGVMPVIAGGRRGEFNVLYGQPSVEVTPGPGHQPPFQDDGDGDQSGLLDRQRALGGLPKILNVLSSSEYWRGDGSLLHASPDGARDLPLAPESRAYLVAGTPHGFGFLPFMRSNPLTGDTAMLPFNVVDSRLPTRAMVERLDAWCRDGTEPPPSAIPLVANGTAWTREAVLDWFGAQLPGIARPNRETLRVVPGLQPREDGLLEPDGSRCTALASAVDADGNEVAGIRLPDVAVPIATHTGWNARDPIIGGGGQILRYVGITLPFAATPDARASWDPRATIAERYPGGRGEYEAKARACAEQLAANGYILAEDTGLAVANALARWDAVAAGVTL